MQIIFYHNDTFKNNTLGTSLAVQWLRLRTSTAGGTGSIPGRGTKILHAVWHGQKEKKKLYVFVFRPHSLFHHAIFVNYLIFLFF